MGRIRHPRHERRAPRHLSTDGASMSNFLQRVAAAVIQPKAKLQPMLGSIFLPATLASAADPSPSQAGISSQTFAPHHWGPITAPHFSSQSFASQAFPSEDRPFTANVPEDSSPARSKRSPASDQLLLPVFNGVRGPTQPHLSVED